MTAFLTARDGSAHKNPLIDKDFLPLQAISRSPVQMMPPKPVKIDHYGWLQGTVRNAFLVKFEKLLCGFRKHQTDVADILRAAAGHHVDG